MVPQGGLPRGFRHRTGRAPDRQRRLSVRRHAIGALADRHTRPARDMSRDMRGRGLEDRPAYGDNQGAQPAGPPRVPAVQAGGIRDCYINVDGIRTHYLGAGDGDPIVLLHSGAFGGPPTLRWEYAIPVPAESYRRPTPPRLF